MSEYERIRAGCLQRGELWEDPDFPATQTSVFYHQTPPFQFVWKRPKQLHEYRKISFVLVESGDFFDVQPGRLGDRWLLSCLGILFLSKELFYRVVPADQNFGEAYTGMFRFRLFWCGSWTEVLVDDRLPTVKGNLAFMQSSTSLQFWPSLLEKAYAKLHGSYEALKYGSLLDGLADMTGGVTESLGTFGDQEMHQIHQLLKTASIVTCVSHLENTPIGIIVGMNYRILALETVESDKGLIYLIKLSRPLNEGEQHSNTIDKTTWKSIPPPVRERQLSTDRSSFWMFYSDFKEVFTHIEVVHLSHEAAHGEPSLANKQSWHMKMHRGQWRKGVSAGGCRNNTEFVHMNPQVQLHLDEHDTVIISLNQHSVMEPKVIGFSVYSLPNYLTETAPAVFFKTNRSIVNSQYSNSRQVSERCTLEAGTYLIVPTTFEPRDEAHFALRVFSGRPAQMNILDAVPQMLCPAVMKAPLAADIKSFAQYEAVFLQLADEHRTVNVFELQELLEACLPNDYIKSCASIDTCRQIVLAMDIIQKTEEYNRPLCLAYVDYEKAFDSVETWAVLQALQRWLIDYRYIEVLKSIQNSGNGRITLNDFKDLICSLKHWQGVFKVHTREKMGVLRVERLRDALRDIGFVLPERAMTLVVLRYVRKDGMLRFGDFVSAVLHLQVAFKIFEQKDHGKSGTIKLSLNEWLKFSLMS